MQNATFVSTLYTMFVLSMLAYKFVSSMDYIFLALMPGVFLSYVMMNRRVGDNNGMLSNDHLTVFFSILSTVSLFVYLTFLVFGR